MVYITRQHMARIAAALGHRDLTVQQTRRGMWVATCSCGMRSTQKVLRKEAIGAAAHHLTKVIKAWETAGRPPIRESSIPLDGKGSNEPAAASTAA